MLTAEQQYIADNEAIQRMSLIVCMIDGGEDTDCAINQWWKIWAVNNTVEPNLTTTGGMVNVNQFVPQFM